MFSELTSTQIKDMILDRIINIQISDRRYSNELEPETDAIILLLEQLHDRTVDINMKTRHEEYVTNAGIHVVEREYDSENIKITMSDIRTQERDEEEDENDS